MCTSERGFTLIELLIGLVVVALLAAGLYGALAAGVLRSVDPMLRMQALAIAQAYLEEILLQPPADPDGPESGCEEAARAAYDDVADYACIVDAPPTDQFGAAMPGLGDYRVDVAVAPETVAGESMQRITVTVRRGDLRVVLEGWR
ncbi:MAG: hypothetical protein KatS3mg121_1050 [Gammaproteobacteria bacterium]|nr:MAG: hypothetical protein KatS3mg121_1050 [Gammaproteobacteria bacterium]